MATIDSYIAENEPRFLEGLKDLLRIPSISALSDHSGDMVRCAEYAARKMADLGFSNTQVMPTGGHPVVYGEWLGAPGAPTVLLYGHYDVQPVDPINLWQSPPFEPEVRGGELYARGAVDDKGQIYMHWAAVEAHMKANGRLPVNLKMLFEGEEEIGSDHLDRFLSEHQDLLKADVAVISDSGWLDHGVPSITYGLRGMMYLQVNVQGPSSDLHSGQFGGAVANPVQVLCEMIAGLKDKDGKVDVPGFYDRVRKLGDEESRQLASLPFDEEKLREEVGVPELYGEKGYSPLEQMWVRPTLDVNGIWGGFTGEGSKTVLPSRASAKISCRLVPDQDPDEITRLVTARLRELCPPTVTMEIIPMHTGKPALTPTDHPAVQAAARAMERAFQKKVAFIRSGGTIPVVASLAELLGLPTVLMGIGLPDEHAHAPNERLDLGNFFGGIRAAAYLWEEMARR